MVKPITITAVIIMCVWWVHRLINDPLPNALQYQGLSNNTSLLNHTHQYSLLIYSIITENDGYYFGPFLAEFTPIKITEIFGPKILILAS